MDHAWIIETFIKVHQLVDVQFRDFSDPIAAGAASLRVIEGKPIRITDKRPSDSGKKKPQQGIGICVCAYCRSLIGSRFLLIYHNGHRQIFDPAYVRPPILWKVLLDKAGKRVV